MCLVYLPAVVLDTVELSLFVRSVVLAQVKDSHATVRRHDSSAVSHICNVAFFLNRHNDYSTAARLLKPRALISNFDKPFLSDPASLLQRFLWVFRKHRLVDNDLVKMIFQEICAHTSAMAVINSEEGALGPSRRIFLFRPRHVQNDRHPIFIIIPLDPLMSVCRITSD